MTKAIKPPQGCGDRFLSRDEIREFKNKTRLGDAEAAVELLRHSVRCRHRKLAFRRYFLAVELGAVITGKDLQYLREISSTFSVDVLAEIRASACRDISSHLIRPGFAPSNVHPAPRDVELETDNNTRRSTPGMECLAIRIVTTETEAQNVPGQTK